MGLAVRGRLLLGMLVSMFVLHACPDPDPVPVPVPLPAGQCQSPEVKVPGKICDRGPLPGNFLSCLANDPSTTAEADAVMPEEACNGCHAGIEHAHPYAAMSCSDCHGGDGTTSNKAQAHVAFPKDSLCGTPVGDQNSWQKVNTLKTDCASDELDALAATAQGAALLRWVNPGDLRVAEVGCGSANPRSQMGGCHQAVVESARRSVMQTFVGHYNLPRFLAGMQDRSAVVGTTTVDDPNYDPSLDLAVPGIAPLQGPAADAADGTIAQVMDEYLPRHCPTCHTANFGKNDSERNYRSSGCTACHMLYDDDGKSRSGDLTIPNTGSHPVQHVLTTRIPTRQCEHCHYQGARIGLNFQGLREHGFKARNYMSYQEKADFVAAEAKMSFVQADIHGHGEKWYACDEDASKAGDETPPDIHFEKGMHCVDCHTSVEVHGDGHIYSTAKGQLDIHCVDCHGSVREPIKAGDDGIFRTASRGTPLRNLSLDDEGKVVLTSRVTGKLHPVVQIKESLDEADPSAPMSVMMGLQKRDDGTEFSHTDTMECWTCHSAWRLNCYGCHVSQTTLSHKDPNWTSSQPNHQTGGTSNRIVKGERFTWDIDSYFLGLNQRGMIDTMCPSMQMFLSASTSTYNSSTEKYDEADQMTYQPRLNQQNKPNFGWMPTHQHTIRRFGQKCSRCHVKADNSNLDEVRATYGFGAGVTVPLLKDANGTPYDLSRMLEDDGTPISEFAHEGTGPVPAEVRQRAFEVVAPY